MTMSSKPSYVLQAFIETPWAILPQKLVALEEIVARHASGEKLSAEEIEARIHGAARPPERRVNSVAVLPLFGTIFPRANLMTDMSGATSAETFGKNFAALLKDPGVGAIVIDVNSPGGASYGIEEVSNQIYEARGLKPIIAVANHLMASAAYWIGTAADELVVTPSGDVGSIGVFAVHQDISAALEEMGVKTSLISAGRYKVVGNPYEPLSEEARAVIQASVDETYDAFVEAVARNRGVKSVLVRSDFGEGRVVGAREAVKLGMADSIGTLEETINRLLGRNVPAGSSSAAVAESLEVGQEPSSDTKPHLQEARARLAQAGNKTLEGETNMLRELINKRATLVERAQEIVALADSEDRDLNEVERKEFTEALDQADQLEADITRIQGERERLRTSAEKQFVTGGAEKPSDSKAGGNVMKRSEFDKLGPEAKAAFAKGNGKIED
jgi:signal peptide peptidase SppA